GIRINPGLAWYRTGAWGVMMLVYVDCPLDGMNQPIASDANVMFRYSRDVGQTWSDPILVHNNPNNKVQFMPAIAVDQSNGLAAVAWYDARGTPDNGQAQIWATLINLTQVGPWPPP